MKIWMDRGAGCVGLLIIPRLIALEPTPPSTMNFVNRCRGRGYEEKAGIRDAEGNPPASAKSGRSLPVSNGRLRSQGAHSTAARLSGRRPCPGTETNHCVLTLRPWFSHTLASVKSSRDTTEIGVQGISFCDAIRCKLKGTTVEPNLQNVSAWHSAMTLLVSGPCGQRQTSVQMST